MVADKDLLTVVIKDNNEPNVIKLTYENLYRELKNLGGAKLVVYENWLDAVSEVGSTYICFVESDCLVNSGYFTSQIGLIKKNPKFRKLSMLSSSVGVNNWANRFYGYSVGNEFTDGIVPNKQKKSNQLYPIQIGYVPGSIIRTNMLRNALDNNRPDERWNNLVYMSTILSTAFWKQGDGNPVYINPNSSYVTTEDYVNNIDTNVPKVEGLTTLMNKFHHESI